MYSELDDKAKERARQWYRNASQDDNYFSEWVIEDAKRMLAFLGIDIDDIGYSGFWSQGEGAHFTGMWRASDCKPGQLSAERGSSDSTLNALDAEFSRLAAIDPYARYCVKHRGQYAHEHCTDFTVESELLFGLDEADNGTRFAEFERDLIDASRDAMRWIYRQLEKAYEYENSDEAIEQTIELNKYEFTVDGQRA
jgi:hypothetical protein